MIHERQATSTVAQRSAIDTLNFLVSDMLDYAELRAGQFRKTSQNFNIVNCVTEIKDIYNFKAGELNLIIDISFELFIPDNNN